MLKMLIFRVSQMMKSMAPMDRAEKADLEKVIAGHVSMKTS